MRYKLATSTWDSREYEALQDVIREGMFTMGPRVRAFEEAFAAWMGSSYAVMVNSGSSANLLAIAALCYRKEGPLRAGDEVVVPAVSWATTYMPLTQYGLHIRFVDIDPLTLNMDLEQLAVALTDRTRLVVAVNLLGNPNDFARLRDIIAGRGIELFEDNCEAMGATFQGKQAGTFGCMGSFSSFFSHHISTMEGGLVVTDDLELYQILLSLRAHGWTRNLPKENLVCGRLDDDLFNESFRFVLPGYNVRPLEMSGALGSCQLDKLADLVAGRRRNAESFVKLFANHPYVSIQQETGASSWFGFSLVLREGAPVRRDALVAALCANEIECRPIVAGNFLRNPVVKHMPHTVHGELPVANWVHDNGLFVGNHHYNIDAELEHLHRVVSGLF
jgi:dTDP-4-amino-4,6-dideoxygalactose transaminase